MRRLAVVAALALVVGIGFVAWGLTFLGSDIGGGPARQAWSVGIEAPEDEDWAVELPALVARDDAEPGPRRALDALLAVLRVHEGNATFAVDAERGLLVVEGRGPATIGAERTTRVDDERRASYGWTVRVTDAARLDAEGAVVVVRWDLNTAEGTGHTCGVAQHRRIALEPDETRPLFGRGDGSVAPAEPRTWPMLCA